MTVLRAAPNRIQLAAAFLLIGGVCVIAGGLTAAVTAPAPTEHASWAAAYLVLVAGAAQIGLGVGRAWLADRRPSPGRLVAELASWNLGNAAVIAGTLSSLTAVVDLGGGLLVVALGLLENSGAAARRHHSPLWDDDHDPPGAAEQPIGGRRWSQVPPTPVGSADDDRVRADRIGARFQRTRDITAGSVVAPGELSSCEQVGNRAAHQPGHVDEARRQRNRAESRARVADPLPAAPRHIKHVQVRVQTVGPADRVRERVQASCGSVETQHRPAAPDHRLMRTGVGLRATFGLDRSAHRRRPAHDSSGSSRMSILRRSATLTLARLTGRSVDGELPTQVVLKPPIGRGHVIEIELRG